MTDTSGGGADRDVSPGSGARDAAAVDRRGRYAAAMSSAAQLDAVLRLVDTELAAATGRLCHELDQRAPDTLVSVRRVRDWLDGTPVTWAGLVRDTLTPNQEQQHP